jgi:maleylpyruvate isomerase
MRDMIHLGQVDPVRKRVADATSALLGDCIVLSDTDWAEPTLLPGWSRAQVAHHLARGADAMREVTLAAIDGRQRPLHPYPDQRLADLETANGRTGLDLQIDLDTTAGGLDESFGLVTDWLATVRLPVGELPLSALVVARLHEVVLHHLDLRTAFSLADLEPVAASWLLQWAALWLRTKPGLPAVSLHSESGVTEVVGDLGEVRSVSGSDADLWGWVTGRTGAESLDGADGLIWRLLG